MNPIILAQEAEYSTGNPILNISVFLVFLIVTMALVLRAGKSTKEASDFYTGGGTFSGRQN
ncbi:MAG: cation acetate symporter, partial [Corynebacterium casei]